MGFARASFGQMLPITMATFTSALTSFMERIVKSACWLRGLVALDL